MSDNFLLQHALDRCIKLESKRRPQIRIAPTVLYFIQAGPFVKIGLTTSRGLESRLSNIQTGCPYAASIIRTQTTDNPYDDEKQMHAIFEPFHYRGEWFKVTPKMIAKVLSSQRWPAARPGTAK